MLRLRTILAAGLLAFGALAACAQDDDASTEDRDLIDKTKGPMTKARVDEILRANPSLVTLDQLPGALPKEYLLNVTLKHGRLFQGEHGHLVESVVSQSSSPSAPRAILWDERSGFAVSYNGGAQGQTEPNRLDTMEFDETAKRFRFAALQFRAPEKPIWQTDADIPEENRKCSRCHGEKTRPIFSMYPDWPSFYGSDNDELSDRRKPVQVREAQEYASFRSSVARSPRYLPLFDDANLRTNLRGTALYPEWPYRPNIDTNIEATSRAFAFRPSLRFGVLMNRLMAISAADRIIQHPNFSRFGALFLHDLLECRWPGQDALETTGWLDAVASVNGARPRTVAGAKTLHYRDLLKMFGLEVADIDIRYSHHHPGYANEDATNKVMEVGYIDNAYWNSYFDGSATIDELMSMHLFKRIAADPKFADIAGTIDNPDGLVVKYSRRVERFKFDKNFFEEMDRKGTWIPIPYPLAKLNEVHHREGFPDRFARQHANLCRKLESHLQSAATADVISTTTPPPAGVCPAQCVASEFCKDHPNAASAIKVGGLPCVVTGAGGCQPCR
jgi:hypothetical protein